MRNWLAKLIFGGTYELRDYEQKVIDAAASAVSDRSRKVIESQVSAICHVVRYTDDRIVLPRFRFDTNGWTLFPNENPEIRLARVEFRGESVKGLRCDIMVGGGMIGSLEFNKPPKLLTDRAFETVKVTIGEERAWEIDVHRREVKIGKVLKSIQSQLIVTGLVPPVTEIEIKRFIEWAATALPMDLIELLSECDGFKCSGWAFHGTRSDRSPIGPECDIIRLYDWDDTPLSLCVKVSAESPEIFLYQQEDNTLTSYGVSLVEAVLRIMKETKPTTRQPLPGENSWPPTSKP